MAKEKVYYCTTCQKGSQYDNIKNKINNLTTCINNNEYITSDFYQKSYALLKEIRDFGDNDSNSPRQPRVDTYFQLEIKNLKNEIISHHFYDDIINSINNNSNSNKTNEIIYGSYWTSLKTTLQNINISNTKYWEKDCCSCNGYCESNGWYCPAYPSGCGQSGSNPCVGCQGQTVTPCYTNIPAPCNLSQSFSPPNINYGF